MLSQLQLVLSSSSPCGICQANLVFSFLFSSEEIFPLGAQRLNVHLIFLLLLVYHYHIPYQGYFHFQAAAWRNSLTNTIERIIK